MSKQTQALDDTITDIGHRIDKLIDLCEAEKVLPNKILNEDFIIRSMFPDGKSSPLKILTVTYIRLEPIIRFLEENLVPELEDRKAKPTATPEKAAEQKALAQSMSDLGTDNIDLNVDRGTRAAVESAVATHAPGGPDIDSAVSGLVEQRDRNIRKINDASTPADRSDRLRATIRNAVREAKDKAAAPPKKPVNGSEAPIGPPLSWSRDARAQWESLPHEARMAALRGEKTFADAVTPIAERLNEIDRVMGPVRPLYQQAGMKSDGEAINHLLTWESHLRNPATRLQAYYALGQSLGIGQGQQQQPEQYQSLDPAAQQMAQRVEAFAQDKPAFQAVRYDMGQLLQANPNAFNGPTGEVDLDRLYQTALQYQQSQGAVQQTIEQFSQGKKHFEKVRVRMGHTLNSSGTRYLRADGSVDLDACYRDACKAEGLSDSSNKRDVSPSSRSPSAALVSNERGKGIWASIKAAIQESRGRL